MNRHKAWCAALLFGCAAAGPVLAQQAPPSLSAAMRAELLASDEDQTLSPERIVAILAPATGADHTRALKPGGAPVPGSTGSGTIPDLKIEFASNSAQVAKAAVPKLAALAMAMRFPQMKDLHLIVAGHTDARGDPKSNQILSQRRAEAVATWLERSGSIPGTQLTAMGSGEEQLADPANPTSPENRRVEVRVQ
jgi:OOP family OmpA-OmpF porin